jgi:MerR family transcriptional regulator, heat shock protein HspR
MECVANLPREGLILSFLGGSLFIDVGVAAEGVIGMSEPDPAAGVYTISVAAELAGVTIRSLRLYERRGLLAPARTIGGTRRFSQDDLHRLRRIAELVADGVNLTGIGKILDLEQDTRQLRGDNTALRADNTRLRAGSEQQPAHPERLAQEKEPARRRSSSRRAPTDAHRDQPSRPR